MGGKAKGKKKPNSHTSATTEAPEGSNQKLGPGRFEFFINRIRPVKGKYASVYVYIDRLYPSQWLEILDNLI